MLLADDFGHGGALVSAITGGEAGIEAKRLRDPAYIKNPDFPVVRSKSGGFVGQPSRQLVLNKPAALEGFPLVSNPYHWEVLVNASSRAWLDANQNLVRDPGEREYPYPVAVHITIGGSGGIVIASDPGMFVNDMMRWNAEYIGWLLDRMMTYPTRVTEVIFDESRHNPESAEAKVGLGLLRLANGYSASAAALVVTFIFGMLAFGYQYHSLPDWRPRRHRDALDRPCLLHFAAPYLTINEFRRLRVAIVERVRLAYGYSPDEFYPAMLPCLAGLMCDAELQAFLETETFPDTVAFQRALQRALAWRPPQADDAAQPPGTADVPYSDVELVDEGACYSQYDFRPASQPGRQSDSLYDPESDRQHDRFPVDSVLYGEYPDTPITNRESPDSPTAGGEAR
jgi:hypothetical protein